MRILKSEEEYKNFFESISPIKLTECRYLKLNTQSWGVLTDYFIESVKINRYKPNEVSSTAILKVGDESGQVTCFVKGRTVGLLFGLTEAEWSDVEQMCDCGQQLFYRYFKDGLSKNFSCEQKHFYNFCLSNQKEDMFIALFCRTNNTRNKDKNNAFLNITEIRKGNTYLLDIYFNHLKISL